MSPGWELDHGGNLELWDDGPRGEPRVVGSRFNRLVVMATDRNSWHSVQPVTRDGRRNCVSNYYFCATPHEREDYQRFLVKLPGTYLVVESDAGRILACGGYAQDSETTAVLTYGMVHADHHRQSIGTVLLQERLKRIRKHLDVPKVVVNTTQLTEGFFVQFGFQTEIVTPDQYAPGLHGVRMWLGLRNEVL